MSTPIYPEIISRRYPDLQISGPYPGNYGTIIMLSGTKPNQAELDALWPSVESEIAQEQALYAKVRAMQSQYHLQTQVIETMKAIINNDTATIEPMVNFWDLL